MGMKQIHMVTFLLLVVGGLNWLLEAFGYNLVYMLFGGLLDGMVERAVYILVGLSAIYELLTHKKTCRACTTENGGASSTM